MHFEWLVYQFLIRTLAMHSAIQTDTISCERSRLLTEKLERCHNNDLSSEQVSCDMWHFRQS